MLTRIKNLGPLFLKAIKKWYNRDPFREGAIIAYNAIFAIPGLLVVAITIAGYFFGDVTVSEHMHKQIAEAVGNNTANQLDGILSLSIKDKDSYWATIIGIIVIIIGATTVFVELQKSLNIIWEVKATTKKSGFFIFLKTRLFSFGLILSIAFLLLISLLLSALLSALSSWMQQYWSESLLSIFQLLNFVLSVGLITLLFAMMFKILPDAKIKWHSVWIGAFVTGLTH